MLTTLVFFYLSVSIIILVKTSKSFIVIEINKICCFRFI
jgi:hypothetical protein